MKTLMSKASEVAIVGLAAVVVSGCGGGASGFSAQAAEPTPQSASAIPDFAPPDQAALEQLAITTPAGTKGGGLVVRRGPVAAQSTTREARSVTPQSIIVGTWNYYVPYYCLSYAYLGVDYMFMYMRDGTYIYTADPVFITALAGGCTSSPAVGIYVTSSNGQNAFWSELLVSHL